MCFLCLQHVCLNKCCFCLLLIGSCFLFPPLSGSPCFQLSDRTSSLIMFRIHWWTLQEFGGFMECRSLFAILTQKTNKQTNKHDACLGSLSASRLWFEHSIPTLLHVTLLRVFATEPVASWGVPLPPLLMRPKVMLHPGVCLCLPPLLWDVWGAARAPLSLGRFPDPAGTENAGKRQSFCHGKLNDGSDFWM